MKVFPDQQILSLFSLAFLISAPLGGELKEEDIWSTAENPSYADAFRFVGAFAAQWPPLPKASYSFWEAYLNFNFVVASFHAPFFSVESQNAGASIRGTAEAIWRDRESGELPSLDSRTSKGQPRARLREQRISLWTKAWIGAKGRNELPRRSHSTLLLTDFRGYYVDEAEYKRLKSSYPADGLVMFQMALLRLLGMWESEWNRVLDEIDKCVRVTVCGTFRIVVELTNFMQIVDILDPDERQKLMFDNSFDCSEVYFAVLQLLRIFDDWIHEAAIEIERFDRLFESDATLRRLGADANTLCENWQLVSQDFLEAQERLEERLKGKTEELKSLRDRLFNATSVLEASRSTSLGRYLMVFTVMTILYLPPQFSAGVFSMPIFQKDDTTQTIFDYKVTTVVLALGTYLIAVLLVVLVANSENISQQAHRL